MSATAIFEFQNFDFLTFRRFKSIIVRHGAKFRDDRSNYCLDMATFRFFKMAAAAIFWIFKFQIFNGWTTQEGRTASLCQILWQTIAEIW